MEKDDSPEGDTSRGLTSQVSEKPERETLLRGFATWLDAALASEELPQGLTAELLSALAKGDPLPPLDSTEPGGGCDLFSLWAGWLALTQEIAAPGGASH